MEIKKVSNIEEALSLLEQGYKPMAGCTNIMVYKNILNVDGKYVDITSIEELKNIQIKDNNLEIGALVTFTTLEEYLKNIKKLQVLYDACFVMGGPQIRNRATLAGNICDASPACDGGAPLLVLDASLEIISSTGKRIVNINDFFIGYKKIDLKDNELVTKIIVPLKDGNGAYTKVGNRNALAISLVSLAYKVENGYIKYAATSVYEKPVRLFNVEAYVNNNKIVDSKQLEIELLKDIAPISDIRATKEYRILVSCNLIKESLKKEFGYEFN